MPRIAILHKDRCNPVGCGGYLCIRVCPVNMQGKQCKTIDPVDKKVKIDEKLTTSACSICQNACPFGAIEMINLPDELTTQPVHTYPPNGLHLYDLPLPQFGKVVGIVGRNGIGKSTAIKILAGVLKPNLGTEKEASVEDLLKYYKGSTGQIFFEKLKKGEIKVSYKPQQVEYIPKSAKGTVKELLRKVDEKDGFDEVVAFLELENVLDTNIDKISGGELQRVAIAATALKKANVYIFDEPTSYLDIGQRLRAARFIRSLVNDSTAVLVVEHDLVILDFMTDIMHIMYGNEGAYGIVSQPKPSRNGINTYLEGFIKEQKMRFRDHEIKFMTAPPSASKKIIPLVSWKNVEKKLGKFSVKVINGCIGNSEVVGILGENGTGKTTFVRILANELTKDSGELTEKVTVSYKPQYLAAESDETVGAYLQEANAKYSVQLIRPLDLEHHMNKPLNKLSGGELQRVFIAHCLGKEADVYLLDEPSAYLDVEQRLAVAKVIKEVATMREKSILVVDHDIVFIDYLSDRLMVFDGEPAIRGEAHGPIAMVEGMNMFLKLIDITMRRDSESYRPRINSPDSRLDREQKESGHLYYNKT